MIEFIGVCLAIIMVIASVAIGIGLGLMALVTSYGKAKKIAQKYGFKFEL